MRQKPALTASDVQKMAAACKAEATKNKWNVTIAIVDDAGYPLYLERLDGAAVHVRDRRRQGGDGRHLAASDQVLGRPHQGASRFAKAPVSTPMQGGVPIMVQDDCVGAIGVSGVQSHEDEQVANAGVAAVQ